MKRISIILLLTFPLLACGDSDSKELARLKNELERKSLELAQKDKQIKQLEAGSDLLQVMLSSAQRNYERCVSVKTGKKEKSR